MLFRQSWTINPDNTSKFEPPVAEIYCNSLGEVNAVGLDGTPMVFKGLVAGSVLRGYFIAVLETGTTPGMELIARNEWTPKVEQPTSDGVTIAGP